MDNLDSLNPHNNLNNNNFSLLNLLNLHNLHNNHNNLNILTIIKINFIKEINSKINFRDNHNRIRTIIICNKEIIIDHLHLLQEIKDKIEIMILNNLYILFIFKYFFLFNYNKVQKVVYFYKIKALMKMYLALKHVYITMIVQFKTYNIYHQLIFIQQIKL